jgi:MinD-like ATPase involved in chromosome partitioning or flagellar assembly
VREGAGVAVVSVHSFRGGTGKSNLTANIAVQLASRGRRVGVVDTDIQSPGIHVLFGLAGAEVGGTLNDHLFRGSPIEDIAHDVTGPAMDGKVYLIPSSVKPGEITRVLREGYDAEALVQALRRLLDALALDTLLIDTHPGLQEETLLSLVVSDTLLVVLRPDQQDYEGTGVTVGVARSIEVPRVAIVVNKAPHDVDPDDIRDRVEEAYGCEVLAVLPHSDAMLSLASAGVFSTLHPTDPLSEQFGSIADAVLGGAAS